MARRRCVRAGPQVRGRLLSPRSLMAAPRRSYTEGSRAAGPGSEECGSEEQLGPGEIGQFFLHGCANRLPRTAHDPLIYGGEPHNCSSELRPSHPGIAGNPRSARPSVASGEGRGAVDDDLCALGHLPAHTWTGSSTGLGSRTGPRRHEADIAQPFASIRSLGMGEHRVGQIDADDPAAGTDPAPQSAGSSDLCRMRRRSRCHPREPSAYGPEALCDGGSRAQGEPGGDVVVLRLLAVCLDQASRLRSVWLTVYSSISAARGRTTPPSRTPRLLA